MRRLLWTVGAAAVCLVTWQAQGADDSVALSRSLAAAEERLGPAHPDLLAILGPLARLRFRDAEIAEATALRRRSLKIAIDAFGNGSVPAAEAMAALASLYIELRRYLDAEPLLIAAGDILSTRLGTEDRAMAPVLSGLARVALARGDKSRARKWAEQAVAIDEKNASEERSGPLRTLGAVLATEGEFAASERVLRQALALDREGKDEAATARTLSQLAESCLRQQHFTAALPLIEEALEIDQGLLGATHPFIADDLYDLGLIYLETGRPGDAARVFKAAIDLLDRGIGRRTPRVGYIELGLARAEHEQGREEKAETLFAEARQILNAAEEEEREREREV